MNRRAKVRRFKKKSLIYAPANFERTVLVLASGRVKIYDLTLDGRQAILAFVEQGELFGELGAMNGQPRREYAEAIDDSEVFAIPGSDFLTLMERRADLALSVTKLVGIRRQRIESRLSSILFLPSRPRLIRVLIELMESHGECKGTRTMLRFPLSHQDLAGLIGVTRETVTHTMGQLQKEGLIAVERKRIIFLDLLRLRYEVEHRTSEATGQMTPKPNSLSGTN